VLLQRLTQLLHAADLHTAQLAAHLVWYVSRSAELRLFLQQQAQLLPALLGLLAGQDVAAARAAAFALNNCAHEQSFRFAMLEAGAVPCLVEMLSGCDALGQEVSCYITETAAWSCRHA
jgi:HEAT repeat protein